MNDGNDCSDLKLFCHFFGERASSKHFYSDTVDHDLVTPANVPQSSSSSATATTTVTAKHNNNYNPEMRL